MAKRRMFSMEIIDSDSFVDMPLSSRLLYYDLNMRADDDGFVNSPKKIMKMVGCSEDDMKLLIAKNFIIPFESGIVVIKHWRIHNYIRNDRKKDTTYTEEKRLLEEKENGSYTLCQPSVNQMSTNCQPSGSIGKDSIGEDSIGEDSIETVLSDVQIVSNTDLAVAGKTYEQLPEQLIKPFEAYLEVRKVNRWKTTDYAIKLLLTKLTDLSNGNVQMAEQIINQSIEKSYRSFFPLKEEKGKPINWLEVD